MTQLILGYILYYSSLYRMDPLLVRAVIEVESRGIMTTKGKAGEVGFMQLLPSSFPNKKLSDPKTNIRLGVSYLAKVRDQCPHQEDYTWLVCYNAGPYGGAKIKYPKLFPYYKLVMAEYTRLQNESQDLSIQARK